MGTMLKIAVIALALVGLCVMLTTYAPMAWHHGWDIPNTKIQVSWAATILVALLTFGLVKIKIA